MSDDESDQKNWLTRISDMFCRAPSNREQLIACLRHAAEKNIIDNESLSMIEGAIVVSDLKVRDIMVPRAKMTTVKIEATLEDCLPIITESGHSRFPVIAETGEEIAGILLAKDLLTYLVNPKAKFMLQQLMRPAIFIPESKRLNVLLREFRSSHNHMAIVVDEYGGIGGLVTIEDVLEQIVGEIEDESDVEDDSSYINQLSPNQYTVKGHTPIEEFNLYFKSNISNEEFDTIGGLVMQSFGHLPKRNEVTEVGNYRFTILHADNRRIRLMKVTVFDAHQEV